MDIDKIKEEITTEIHALGGGIPFDSDSLPNTWNDLLIELRKIINHIELSVNVLVNYEHFIDNQIRGDVKKKGN